GWRKPPPVIDGTARTVSGSGARKSGAGFAAGDRVFHQKFGYGDVLRVEQDKLEISFEHAGVKKVMDAFVKRADEAG
ncbi:MAG TPA: hypothetical protein PKZ99_09820, partial [Azospirillaceae bacterium]|nr:hypothetical protein [Azospirillaceae bacterium]